MKKNSLSIWFFSILVMIAIAALAYYSWKEKKREKNINAEIESLRREAEAIRNSNRSLRERIEYFQTPEFRESVAKEKLNLQKQDEQVVIIKPSQYYESKTETETKINETESLKADEPNYIKWWKIFFNH